MTALKGALAAALIAAGSIAAEAEPTGCGAFRWPIETERAALIGQKTAVANGGALHYGQALSLELQPFAEAGLPHAPERAPRASPSFAGHFALPAPAKPGLYKVTIASDGWIDVVNDGAFLHPRAFSGAQGCDGARKSVEFELPARPLDVQLSGVRDASIGLIITPAQ